MNIKPYRDIDPHEVIDLFSLVESAANKGSFVEGVSFNPSAQQGWSTLSNSNPGINGTISLRHEVKAKAKLATSGSTSKVIGMAIYDVKESNDYSEKFIFRPKHEQAEQQCVVSGQAVPLLTRGIVEVVGFSGVPGIGSGIQVSDAGNGEWKVVGPAVTPRLGIFLSSTGADGYAIAKISIN